MRNKRLFFRLLFVGKLIKLILSDNLILIEDKGAECKTIISSGVSKERVRLVFANLLQSY